MPPVKPINELIDVLRQITMAHTMKDAQQKPFQVRDDQVHLGQPRHCLFRGRYADVVGMSFGKAGQSRQRVAVRVYATRQMLLSKDTHHHLIEPVAQHPQPPQSRQPGHGFSTVSKHPGVLLSAPRSCLPARRPPTSTSSTSMISPDSRIDAVTIMHGLSHVLQHEIGGGPTHTKQLGQAQRRNTALVGAIKYTAANHFLSGTWKR